MDSHRTVSHYHQPSERMPCPTGPAPGIIDDIEADDLIRFDRGLQSFVIVRSKDDSFHAMNGICNHEKLRLCDGLVMKRKNECPRFVHRLRLHGTGLGDHGIPIPQIGALGSGMMARARDTLHRFCDLAKGWGQAFTLENLPLTAQPHDMRAMTAQDRPAPDTALFAHPEWGAVVIAALVLLSASPANPEARRQPE